MSRRDTSVIDCSVEEMMRTTIAQQGHRLSKQASEMAKLKVHLTHSEANLNNLSNEVRHWKNEHQKAKDEAFRHAGALSKANRERKALDDAIKTMRDDTSKKALVLQEKLQHELKMREKHEYITQAVIEDLKYDLKAKDSEIEQLQEQCAEIEQHLKQSRNGKQGSRGNVRYTPPRQLTGQFAAESYHSQLHRLERPRASKADADRIAQLEKEVQRLTAIHASHGCEEYQTALFQQLGDALETQKAAEAEGLRHLAKMNELLRKRRDMDAERIVQLMTGKGEGARCTQLGLSAVMLQFETSPRAVQMDKLQLCFSDVFGLATEPAVAQQAGLDLSDIQTVVKGPLIAQQSVLAFSDMQVVATEPVVSQQDVSLAVPHHDVLCLSSIQATSITPHVAADTPATHKFSMDPALIAALQDLGNDIMALSTTPPPLYQSRTATLTAIPPKPVQQHARLPNVALTITIKPSEKRNWALLQHVQRAISTTSSLDINGPHKLVHQFVTEMAQAERDHVEKTSLVKQWEKVAAEHRGEVDALKEEMKQGKCGLPQYRELAVKLRAREHELEAKESQFQMLLLSYQDGFGRHRGRF